MKLRLANWPGWLPESLFGRHVLLLLSLIILAALLLGVVLRHQVQQPRLQQYQQFVLQQARINQAFLSSLDLAQRRHWQRQTAKPPSDLAPSSALPAASEFRDAARFMTELRSQLPNNLQLRWQIPATQQAAQARLWLLLEIAGETYYQELDSSALRTRMTPMIIALLSAAAILAVLGAIFISRRLNAPLQELAQVAARIGEGHQAALPAHLHDRKTALEIRQLAQALQQLANNLEAEEKERNLMLAGVSHDLRTPLTKLRLACELLEQSDLNTEDKDLLQGMVRHIAQANGLIAQFIHYARKGSDEAPQWLKLGSFLQEVAASYPQVELLLDTNLKALDFMARPETLRRALGNLLENAQNYAPAESAITLNAQIQAGQLHISVADRGPGIAAAQKEYVRQPFTRLEQVRSQQAPPGFGLGLAIVDRVARLHQGQLHLLDRAGGGLLAVLELPLSN